MIETRLTRLLTLGLLIGVLCGLLLWASTLEVDQTRNAFPDEDDLLVDYNAYVGERIETSGLVLSTDPVVIEVVSDGRPPLELALTNVVPSTVEVGDDVSVFGTLEVDNTVTVINTTVRQPWEYHYMYLVSFSAGLWTLGRFIRHWTIDLQTLSFIPREVD